MPTYTYQVGAADEGRRLDTYLRDVDEPSETRSQVKKRIDRGEVSVNGETASKGGVRIEEGDDEVEAFRQLAVTYENGNADLALKAYHWTFLAQPAPLPERLIHGDPAFYLEHTLRSWTKSGTLEPFEDGALEGLIQAGYSADSFAELTAHEGCGATDLFDDGTFFHDCDAIDGDSGSPIFRRDPAGGFTVMGIMSATYPRPDDDTDEDEMAVMLAGIEAMREAGLSPLDGEPENLLRLLTDDDVSSGMQTQARQTLDLALALHAAEQCEVMVANPRLVKGFAQALAQRSKTDKADARTILAFAERMPFEPWEPPEEAVLELRAMARRIADLTVERTREGFHGPRLPMRRRHPWRACLPLRFWTPQRLTGPWVPLPFVTPATSRNSPARNTSVTVCSPPSSRRSRPYSTRSSTGAMVRDRGLCSAGQQHQRIFRMVEEPLLAPVFSDPGGGTDGAHGAGHAYNRPARPVSHPLALCRARGCGHRLRHRGRLARQGLPRRRSGRRAGRPRGAAGRGGPVAGLTRPEWPPGRKIERSQPGEAATFIICKELRPIPGRRLRPASLRSCPGRTPCRWARGRA